MTATTNDKATKEAVMFSVTCPCGCDEILSATTKDFQSTTITVEACSKWAANGIKSSTLPKSYAVTHAADVVVGMRHVDGLVTMTGAA